MAASPPDNPDGREELVVSNFLVCVKLVATLTVHVLSSLQVTLLF